MPFLNFDIFLNLFYLILGGGWRDGGGGQALHHLHRHQHPRHQVNHLFIHILKRCTRILICSMWGDNSTYHSTRPPSAATPALTLSRPDSASLQVIIMKSNNNHIYVQPFVDQKICKQKQIDYDSEPFSVQMPHARGTQRLTSWDSD